MKNVAEGNRAGLRFYAVTETGDIDITEILNPEMDIGSLGAWANEQGVMLAFRTPPKAKDAGRQHQPSRR